MRRTLLAAALSAVTGAALFAAAPVASAAGVPSKYLTQKIDWKPCYTTPWDALPPGSDNLLCGSFTAPMDWSHPGAHPDITIAASKLAATGPAKGAALVNAGSTFFPLADPTELIGRTKLTSSVDLLGFDPRGTGRSTNTTCGGAASTFLDLHDRSQANLTKILDAEQKTAADCQQAGGEFQPFVNTEQTVHDLDLLRTLVGRDKLSWIGSGDGAALGARYATYFPGHVDKVVLDSTTDFTVTEQQVENQRPAAMQRRFEQDFLPWVAKYDSKYHLGATPAAVARTYQDLKTTLTAKPATIGDIDFDGGTLDEFVIGGLYSSASFTTTAALASGLKAVSTGQPLPDGTPVFRATPGPNTGSTADDADIAASTAFDCNDTPWHGDRQSLIASSGEQAKKFPLTGTETIYQPCVFWHRPDLSLRTPNGHGVPPVLMIHGTTNPAAPYEGGVRSHRAFAGSRLITVPDQGDTQLYGNRLTVNTCVDNAVESFIVDGRTPAHDLTCAAAPLPDPAKAAAPTVDPAKLLARSTR
jgi:pimeloyl-ACP methyl ester carboxylesterase